MSILYCTRTVLSMIFSLNSNKINFKVYFNEFTSLLRMRSISYVVYYKYKMVCVYVCLCWLCVCVLVMWRFHHTPHLLLKLLRFHYMYVVYLLLMVLKLPTCCALRVVTQNGYKHKDSNQ